VRIWRQDQNAGAAPCEEWFGPRNTLLDYALAVTAAAVGAATTAVGAAATTAVRAAATTAVDAAAA